MSMSLTMSPQEKQKFSNLINEMVKATGAESEKVLRNIGRDFCYAALRATPAVRANRSPKWVKVKGKKNVYVPWHRKGKILKKRQAGGLTKAGWSGCLAKLGKPGKGGKKSSEWSEVKVGKGFGKSFLRVANTAPYIEDFDKGKNPKKVPLHIGQKAKQEVLLRMDKTLTKMAQRVVRRTIGNIV